MQKAKIVKLSAKGFILFSSLCLLSVSLMAFVNPQSVMDLVAVDLSNTDAVSSIRGVYGGVGLSLFISLVYLMLRDVGKGLILLAMIWGFYALSRLITLKVEGPLGGFGQQWLVTESFLFFIALGLLFANKKTSPTL